MDAGAAQLFGYAQGSYRLTVIIGVIPSTDNVTAPSELRCEAFADGVLIGSLVDRCTPWHF